MSLSNLDDELVTCSRPFAGKNKNYYALDKIITVKLMFIVI